MSRAREFAVSRSLTDRCSGSSIASVLTGCGIRVQSRAPDAKHDGLDDTGPEQQNAADHRNRTEPGGDAAGDKYHAHDDERRRNNPEVARVFDGTIAF
ncbi:MAG: hypothetical protein K0R44_3320 [Thermomicrobiales bacterium]|nr:hypothetical protein [Thermomicrobiales bacterium]MDF3018095.1 hypothetical protein [Thermomicrobiales bacterium]